MTNSNSSELRAVRAALETLIREHGVELKFHARLGSSEAGFFEHMEYPPDRIVILRPEHCGTPGPEPQETFDLAHEFGHFISFRDGGHTDALQQARHLFNSQGALEAPARRLIQEEEERAWAGARAALARVGWQDWSVFDAHVAASLDIYRNKLDQGEQR